MIQREATDFKDFDFVNDYSDTLKYFEMQEARYRDLKYKLMDALIKKNDFKIGDTLLCVKEVGFDSGEIDKVGDTFVVDARTVNYYNHYLNKPHYVKKCQNQ